MAQTAPLQHSPNSVPKRPKGILKNSGSYAQSSPDARMSPPAEPPSFGNNDGSADGRPNMPPREMSEKEIVQMNTEMNAGGHRRNSSNPRSSIGRRLSSQTDTNGHTEHPDGEMRLKWDEANLYLNEGQMGGKMKIDEPKTPYAKQYDPAEDEEEIETINAEELAVDELDMGKARPSVRKGSGSRAREGDIPDIDLGEPEMDPKVRRDSDGERRVHVDSVEMEQDGGSHGEQSVSDMTREERDKHEKFEQMRKKHYEMKNIKSLLGHPEQLDALDDDEEK